MVLPDGIIDREKGKFVEDAAGNIAVRMVAPTSRYGLLATKNVAFDGSAGNGATGTVALFTITGDVLLAMVATCSENLAGATATLEVGISGDTASILAQQTATDIDSGDVWQDSGLTASIVDFGTAPSIGVIMAAGPDIIATIATANITDGTIDFYALYTPLSSTGAVVAA